MRKTSQEALEETGQIGLSFTKSLWVINNPQWSDDEVNQIRFDLLEETLEDLQDGRVKAAQVVSLLEWIMDEAQGGFTFEACFKEAQRLANDLKNTGIEKYEKYYGVSLQGFRSSLKNLAIKLHKKQIQIHFFDEVLSDFSKKGQSLDQIKEHVSWVTKDSNSLFSFETCFQQIQNSTLKKHSVFQGMSSDDAKMYLLSIAETTHHLSLLTDVDSSYH